MCFRWLYTRLHCLISLLLGVLIALALESLEHCVFRQPESDLRFCIFALLSLWAKQVAHVKMFEPHIIRYHFSKDSSAFLCYQRLWTYPQTGWIFQRSKDSPIFWDLRWGYSWMICMDYGWYHLPSISQPILFEYGDLNTEKCFMTQDTQLEMPQSKNHLIKKAEICDFDVFFVDCLRITDPRSIWLPMDGRKPPNPPEQAENLWGTHSSPFQAGLGGIDFCSCTGRNLNGEFWWSWPGCIVRYHQISIYLECEIGTVTLGKDFVESLKVHVSGGPCTWCSNWFAEV